jgi:hypothetical protein
VDGCSPKARFTCSVTHKKTACGLKLGHDPSACAGRVPRWGSSARRGTRQVWPCAGMREFLLTHFVAVSSADHGAARAAGSASSRNERGAYGDAATSASPAEAAIVPRLAGRGRQLRSGHAPLRASHGFNSWRRQVQNQNIIIHWNLHKLPHSRSLRPVVTELFPARGQPHPLWPSH